MKIMQAIGGAGHGGAETFFVNLALAFEGAGFEQLIASRSNNVRDAKLKDAGIDPVSLKFGGALDWSSARELNRLSNQFKPDIYLSWMSRAASMIPSGNFPKVARLGGYYKLKYFKKCDHLVGITKALCDYVIQEGWPADRVHYIPNFVNWTPTPPVSRKDFDTPDGVPLLLALGRLHPIKGLDLAIRALAQLKDAYLWIAGTGPQEEELKTLAKECKVADRVKFLGWRTDKEALLAAADIAVFPSRQEGFGTVILEAWASNTPIAAARAQGPAAYIRHGENGMLSDIEDVNSLAHNIQQLINDPKLVATMVSTGDQEYQNKFTEPSAVENWKNYFSSLI